MAITSETIQHPPISERVEQLLAELTLTEQVALLSGSELFETTGVERLGVPRIRLLDGPGGIRGTEFLATTSLSVPCGSALGATWDRELVGQIGAVLGRQARAKGARVHLAPTLNLHRTPIGGRNFESFGEDPLLVAELGAAYVSGVGSQGVGSCVKHFVGNDTEHERFTIDSRIDARTLHEVYLRPFEAAVRAGAAAVMAAYNIVNGTTVSEHAELLGDVLREQWGFEGPVISDWYGTRSTVEALVAGTDLEMPGPTAQRGQQLLDAVADGSIDPAVIAIAVGRMLTMIERLGGFDDGEPGVETTLDGPDDRAVVRRAAASAMVLLRNEPVDGVDVLPLRVDDLRRVAIIGPNAAVGQIGGGGSSMVRPTSVSHPLAALRRRLDGVDVHYAAGTSINTSLAHLDLEQFTDLRVELFDTPGGAGDPGAVPASSIDMNTSRLLWFRDPFHPDRPPSFSARLLSTFVPDRTGDWTIGLRSIGDGRLIVDGEVLLDNGDAELGAIAALGKPEMRTTIHLEAGVSCRFEAQMRRESDADGLSGLIVGCEPPMPDDPIGEAVAIAEDADVTILVVGTNGDWETEGRDRTTISLPGDQDELIRRVAAVSAKTIVVVNAGAPVAMPWLDEVDAVLVAWFPGETFGDALADVLTGEVEPGGRLPTTFPMRLDETPTSNLHPGVDGVADYAEGRLIGHRWFDAHECEPLFPFGFGLGYAELALVDATVRSLHVVAATVTNRSDRDGVVVVQVYAGRNDRTSADDPVRQLVGFTKAVVDARSTRTIEIELDSRMFQTWDVGQTAWVDHDHALELCVGTSSRDLPFVLAVPV